jgi:hypothetical protein
MLPCATEGAPVVAIPGVKLFWNKWHKNERLVAAAVAAFAEIDGKGVMERGHPRRMVRVGKGRSLSSLDVCRQVC